MPVLGIGGLFFRARDPDALSAWYRDHLNVGAGCVAGNAAGDGDGAAGGNPWMWQVQGGPMVFAPFREDTDYLPAGRQWMLNLRVSGLDALIDALDRAGITVETRAEWDDPATGRFARLHDPEGNAIELWQPPA